MADLVIGFSYAVKDGHGVSALSYLPIKVVDTTTLAALRAAWIAGGVLVDGASEGKVTSGRITFLQPGDASFKANPVAASDDAMAAILQFSLQNTTHTQSIVVPALREQALPSGRVNLNEAGLHALIAGLITGFGAGTAYKLTDENANVVTGINRGFLGTRKHRKQQALKTQADGSSYVP